MKITGTNGEVWIMPNEKYYCSFCGKSQNEVKLIAGPTVFICYECIDLCMDVREDRATPPRFPPVSMMRAAHLTAILKDAVSTANRAIEAFEAYREELEKLEKRDEEP